MNRDKIIRRYVALILLVSLIVSFSVIVYASTDNGDTIVYRTRTGYAYHRENCGHLRSKIALTLREAVAMGLSPCEHCNPPIYNGAPIPTAPERSSSGSSGSDRSSQSSSSTQRSGKTASSTVNEKSSGKTASSRSQSSVSPSGTKKSTSSFPWGTAILLFLVIGVPGGLYLWGFISEKISEFRERKNRPIKELQEYHKLLAESDARNQLRAQMLAEIMELRSELPKQIHSLIPLATRTANAATDLSQGIVRLNQDLNAELSKHKASFDRGILTTNDGPIYGDSCTVYFSQKGSCYHYRRCPHNPGIYHSHILSPPSDKKPCTYCHPYLQTWMKKCSDLRIRIDDLEQLQQSIDVLSVERLSRISARYDRLQKAEIIFDYGTTTIRFKN